MFGLMKDAAPGIARVVSYEAFTTPGQENNSRPGAEITLQAQIVVEAEGLEPTAVEWVTNFPLSALPLQPGASLPVTVDRKNPKRVKLDPQFTKRAKEAAKQQGGAAAEAARAQAEELAATLREGSSEPVSTDSLVVPSPGPPAEGSTGDDTISKLERLAKLHDAGSLTDDEFRAQKQRILGSG